MALSAFLLGSTVFVLTDSAVVSESGTGGSPCTALGSLVRFNLTGWGYEEDGRGGGYVYKKNERKSGVGGWGSRGGGSGDISAAMTTGNLNLASAAAPLFLVAVVLTWVRHNGG